MSYEVSLELRETGRFELTFSDVSPEGGRVVRMQGAWEAAANDDGSVAVHATADSGSETTWSGDMHRHQHRDPNGPSFATERTRRGVSTHERSWPVMHGDSGVQLQLDAELGTRVGRVSANTDAAAMPRCDPGRFND